MMMKHAANPADVDRSGTDSYRHLHEGKAERVLVESPGLRSIIERRAEQSGPEELARRYFDGADIVLATTSQASTVAQALRGLRPGGRILLITFVYDQTKVDGPPFSVPESDVWALFSKHGTLTKIDEREDAINARFAAAGISDLREAVFVVERN